MPQHETTRSVITVVNRITRKRFCGGALNSK
jgi:hypothetical protein